MDFECPPLVASIIDIGLQELNLAVAIVTSVIALYVSVVMFWWWCRLRKTGSSFSSFILDVGMAKAALCFWATTGVVQIMVMDMTQPLIILPARLIWLFVVIRQAIMTFKYYSNEDEIVSPPGPFQK